MNVVDYKIYFSLNSRWILQMAANSGFWWELLPLLSADTYINISSLLEAMNSEIIYVRVNSATKLKRKKCF